MKGEMAGEEKTLSALTKQSNIIFIRYMKQSYVWGNTDMKINHNPSVHEKTREVHTDISLLEISKLAKNMKSSVQLYGVGVRYEENVRA